MEVGFNPLSQTTPANSLGLGSGGLGQFEFLKLLVAQLSNQDPLEPVANTEFVSQLAQFSSLGELIKIRQINELSAAVFAQILNTPPPEPPGEPGVQEPAPPAEPPGATTPDP